MLYNIIRKNWLLDLHFAISSLFPMPQINRLSRNLEFDVPLHKTITEEPEVYLEPNQTSTMELFCENNLRFLFS